jgi:hypothetical protein
MINSAISGVPMTQEQKTNGAIDLDVIGYDLVLTNAHEEAANTSGAHKRISRLKSLACSNICLYFVNRSSWIDCTNFLRMT